MEMYKCVRGVMKDCPDYKKGNCDGTYNGTECDCAKENHSHMLPTERADLQAYRSLGTVEEFRALKEAEQKRLEGCGFCNIELDDYPYVVAHSDDDSSGTMYEPAFCPICGRDLRGESHDGD